MYTTATLLMRVSASRSKEIVYGLFQPSVTFRWFSVPFIGAVSTVFLTVCIMKQLWIETRRQSKKDTPVKRVKEKYLCVNVFWSISEASMQSALLMCLTSNDPQGKMKDRRIRKKRQKCRKKRRGESICFFTVASSLENIFLRNLNRNCRACHVVQHFISKYR